MTEMSLADEMAAEARAWLDARRAFTLVYDAIGRGGCGCRTAAEFLGALEQAGWLATGAQVDGWSFLERPMRDLLG